MAASLADDSPWKPYLQIIGVPRSEREARQRTFAETLVSAPTPTLVFLFSSMARFPELLDTEPAGSPAPHPLSDFTDVAAAGLTACVISAVREERAMPRHTVEEKTGPILKLAQAAIKLDQTEESRTILFSWRALADCANKLLADEGTSLVDRSDEYDPVSIETERIAYLRVRQIMPEKASAFYHQMVLRRGTLDTISIVGHAERRGR